ncbi:phage tail protein [Gordonia rubripertincta]|uniref:phage tail protein n=1 Tax=Gordonia rubripertincta TaxID=36822 RepID=UPI0015F79740|nr:hypothetical protein [Gordonia rubripertincta]QMU18999.1 hypothetical protein H3V45_12845 [Gordonia rubripertincta]
MADDVIYVPVAPSAKGFTATLVKEASGAARSASAAMDKELARGGRESGRSAARGVDAGLSRGDIGVNSVKARMAKLAASMRSIGRRAGSEGAAGINAGLRDVDYHKVGDEHGRRYGHGFVSGMRSGLKGVIATVALVNGSITAMVRHVGTAATVIGWASRMMRHFAASVLVGATAMQALGAAGLGKLAGWLKVVASLASRLARDVARAAAAVLVFSAAVRTLGRINRISRIIGALTVGLAALIGIASTAAPALAALGAAIATIGSAAGGIGIAGVSALGAALGSLKAGLFGVGDAFKEMGTSAGGGAAKAVDNTKNIERAQRNLAKSVEAEKDAQKDVARARDDARKKLRDLDLQLRGAALSEKDAQLSLREARRDLAKGGFESGTDRERAVLAVQDAELRLAEVQRDNRDLSKEAADTRAKGVNKADEVVEAQKRLRDATQETKDAQEELNEARNPKDTGTSGGVDKQAEALAKLSANARNFVETAMGIKPAWDAIQRGGQDTLFAGLPERLQGLADTWLPRIGGAMNTVNAGFNRGAKGVADWLTSAQGIPIMSSWLRTSSTMAAQAGTALGALVPGLAAIGAGAGEAFAPMVAGATDGAKSLSEMLIQAQQSGRIKSFFVDAFNQVKQVIQNVTAVVGPLMSAFMQLGRTSAAGLAPGLKSMGDAIREATPGLVQMAERLMPALGQALTNLSPIIPGIVHAFSPWATILSVMAPHIATVMSHLGPMAPILLTLAVTVKAITMAMTLYNAVMAVASVVQGVYAAATGAGTTAIRRNTIALAAYKTAQLAGSIATGIATAATTAFGIALAVATSPITWIVVAIGALVAALVLFFTKTEVGRKIWAAAWGGIKAAVGAVWSWLQNTVWPAMMAAFRAIGAVAMWLWRSIILPVWNGIKAAIGIAWTIIKGYFTAWSMIFRNVIGPVVMWLWRSIITPAFNAIKAVIGVVWNVVKTIFNGWVLLFRNVIGPIIMWFWRTIVMPAFRAIGAVISWAWNTLIKPAWDAFKRGLDVIGNAVKWLWNSIIKPTWDALGKGIAWVVDNIIMPAWDAFKRGIETIKTVFETVVDGIGKAWDKIKSFVAKPINFVIGTVWNKGLLPAWNTIAKFLPGLNPMQPLAEVKFADGGPVPMSRGAQRGKDSVHALMMPDEHVWNVRDVRRAGGHSAMYRMRSMVESGRPFTWTPGGVGSASEGGPLPRFEKGGAVSGGDKLAPLSGEGGLKPIAVMMRRLIFRMWKQITDIGGYRQDAYPEHPSGRALDIMVPNAKTGDEVNGWVHANSKKFPIEHTIWQQRWRPQGNPKGEPMEDRGSPTQNHMDHVHSWWKEQNVDPNKVPGGLVGYDGLSDADKLNIIKKKISEILDKAINPIKQGMASIIGSAPPEWLNIPGKALDITKTKAIDTAFSLAGKLGDKLADAYDKAKDITKVVTNVITAPGRAIGGLFRDQGGYLPKGLSLVRNETGKPEAVLNWEQLDNVKAMMEAFRAVFSGQSPEEIGTRQQKLSDEMTARHENEIKGLSGQQLANVQKRHDAERKALEDSAARAEGYRASAETIRDTPKVAVESMAKDTADFFGFGRLFEAVSGLLQPQDATTSSTAGAAGTSGGATDPVYGDGSGVESGESPSTTKMPDFEPEGADRYPWAIADQAKKMNLPKRAAIIGVATGLVESGDPMKMWANNAVPESLKFPHDAVGSDHDSIGLFQQRSSGWGSVADRMDPHRSAASFYNALVKVPGWETMDMGAAAQAVQRSAFPGKYAQKMGRATELVDKFGIYDQGGWLKPGGLALNLSKRPEPILNGAQWASIDAMLESLPSASEFKSVADLGASVMRSTGRAPSDPDDGQSTAGRAGGPLVVIEKQYTHDPDEAARKTGREVRRATRSEQLVGGW